MLREQRGQDPAGLQHLCHDRSNHDLACKALALSGDPRKDRSRLRHCRLNTGPRRTPARPAEAAVAFRGHGCGARARLCTPKQTVAVDGTVRGHSLLPGRLSTPSQLCGALLRRRRPAAPLLRPAALLPRPAALLPRPAAPFSALLRRAAPCCAAAALCCALLRCCCALLRPSAPCCAVPRLLHPAAPCCPLLCSGFCQANFA